MPELQQNPDGTWSPAAPAEYVAYSKWRLFLVRIAMILAALLLLSAFLWMLGVALMAVIWLTGALVGG